MSLLFDALKRAQGNDAKALAQIAEESAKQTATILAASNRPKTNALPYAIAGLVLLSGVTAWYFYQLNQYTAISTQHAAPGTELISTTAPTAESQPVAASSVAQAIASLPATGAGIPANSAWTHPVAAKKPHSKRHPRKIAKPIIQPASDPLKEAYIALSEGHLDQAEIKYLAVLLQYPHEKDALLGLAVIAQRKLQTERAADLYHQVLREDLGNTAAAAGLVSLSAQADPVAAEKMVAKIEEARKNGDSLGAILQCVVKGAPAGLGDPCFDKLNARLAHALMSIASVKGVEFGDGFAVSQLTGSVNNDRFVLKGQKIGTATNHAGGIIGGISTGEDINIRMAVKPTSSICKPQKTLDETRKEVEVLVKGRHDPCLAPRVVPVAEAMIALTLVDALMIQKATNL